MLLTRAERLLPFLMRCCPYITKYGEDGSTDSDKLFRLLADTPLIERVERSLRSIDTAYDVKARPLIQQLAVLQKKRAEAEQALSQELSNT